MEEERHHPERPEPPEADIRLELHRCPDLQCDSSAMLPLHTQFMQDAEFLVKRRCGNCGQTYEGRYPVGSVDAYNEKLEFHYEQMRGAADNFALLGGQEAAEHFAASLERYPIPSEGFGRATPLPAESIRLGDRTLR